MKNVTPKQFKEIGKKGKNVILDVWSETCEACSAMDRILKQIEGNMDNVEFLRLDANEHFEFVTEQLDIHGTPTLVYVKQGKIVNRVPGVPDYLALRKYIREVF